MACIVVCLCFENIENVSFFFFQVNKKTLKYCMCCAVLLSLKASVLFTSE